MMDVYLIPTVNADQYQLYYEAPDTELEAPDTELIADDGAGPGWLARLRRRFSGLLARMRRRFSAMLREAEEWRHRRHEHEEQPATGIVARLRRHVMGFVVERIAEQRLLWHMRWATDVCAQIPSDLTEERADAIIRAMLKKDADHHFKWIWIDLLLLVLVAPLMLIPGPNLPGFYFTFQVVGHFLSYLGARRGLTEARWTIRQNAALTELRALLNESAPQRARRVHELAARLRLQHLATFFEQVAST